MEFGIAIPKDKPFDAVAQGLNAIDHLVVVRTYPRFNSKTEFISHTVAPGGESATAMVALSRLGLKTRYIGKVGADRHGGFQLDWLKRQGVDTSRVGVVEGCETQTAFIIIDEPSGERTVLWKRDERLAITPEEVDPDAITSGRVLLVNGPDIEASITAARYARDAGVPVVVDIETISPGADRLLPFIDFLISSSDFPRQATGTPDLRSALAQLSARYRPRLVATTLGDQGVLAYFQGHYIQSPAFKIECKDTTGAGDAFHGGFIYGLLNALSVEETLQFANAVAALKCRAIGAQTSLPSLAEARGLLGQ
jgi:sugar/nucleoside kinase (ribokinase family)